jgi:hypothetical protein
LSRLASNSSCGMTTSPNSANLTPAGLKYVTLGRKPIFRLHLGRGTFHVPSDKPHKNNLMQTL